MADETTETVDETIIAAAEAVEKDLNLTEETTEETTEGGEETPEGEEETPEGDPDGMTSEQLTQAKQLYKVLNNPATATKALELMLAQSGLKVSKLDKEDKKDVAKSVKEYVKEKLGPKYEFISDDLGGILQDIFDRAKAEAKEESDKVAAELRATQEKEVRKELEGAYTKVFESYSNIDVKILNEVKRIQESEELVLGPKTNPEKYFRAAFTLAAENLGVSLSKKTSTTRTEITRTTAQRGAAKVSSDLAGKRGAGTEHKDGLRNTQVKSLDEIIKAAAEKIEADA